MPRTNGPEMAMVDRGDDTDPEPFSDGDHGSIHRTKREIGALLHELGHPDAVIVVAGLYQ